MERETCSTDSLLVKLSPWQRGVQIRILRHGCTITQPTFTLYRSLVIATKFTVSFILVMHIFFFCILFSVKDEVEEVITAWS